MKKNIAIVGASSGIGLELARILHPEHRVIAFSRTPGPLSDMGIDHFPMDVTQPLSIPEGVPETLHGLVYCPGSIQLRPFKMLTEEAFRADMEIHFMGLVRVAQALLPRMADGSSAVFFSTVAVGSGMPFHTSVAAAKGAIEGFARALAAEYAPKLRVNVIAPSLVDTPLAKRLLSTPAKQEAMAARHPLQRIGSPADIATMAAFLLSESSSWMTGQVLGVDGGLSSLNLS